MIEFDTKVITYYMDMLQQSGVARGPLNDPAFTISEAARIETLRDIASDHGVRLKLDPATNKWVVDARREEPGKVPEEPLHPKSAQDVPHEDALQLINAVRWCQFNLVAISTQLVGLSLLALIFGLRR